MEELISIIVPIYNSERYLRNCFKYLYYQTYKNLEIILVNDGSTDKSEKICDEYAKRDKRVRIITKENSGLGSSRNRGVSEAKGKYIIHIDSDDMVAIDYVQYLYSLIKENSADISICNYKKIYKEKQIKNSNKKQKQIIFSKESALEALLYQKYFTSSTWAKMFSKELAVKINFPDGTAEDVSTTYKFIHESKTIVYGTAKKYFYLQRKGSIVHSKLEQRQKDCILAINEMEKFISENYPQLMDAVYSRKFSIYIQQIIDVPFWKKLDNKLIFNNIRNLRKKIVLNHKCRLKNKLCAYVSYLGVGTLRVALKLCKGLK